MLFGKKKDRTDYYNSGLEKYNAKEYPLALEFFQAALDKEPQNVDILQMLAKTYGKLGKVGLQKQILDQIKTIQPGSLTPHQTKGFKNKKAQQLSSPSYSHSNNTVSIWWRKRWTKPDKIDYLLWAILGVLFFFLIRSSLNTGWLSFPTATAKCMIALTIIATFIIIVASANIDGMALDDETRGCGSSLAFVIIEIVFLIVIGRFLRNLELNNMVFSGMTPFVIILVVSLVVLLFAKHREIKMFGMTSSLLCLIVLIILSIPRINLSMAEKEYRTVLKESKQLHDQRINENRGLGFMNIMIGDDIDRVVALCSDNTELCIEEESTLSKGTTTTILGEEMVFDTVLRIVAQWDNSAVYVGVYCRDEKVSVIEFNTQNDILGIYEKKYGASEKIYDVNKPYRRAEYVGLRKGKDDWRERYYYPYFFFDKDAFDAYQWTFKNATIRINNHHAYTGFSYKVQYLSSDIVNAVNDKIERRLQEEKKQELEAEKERQRQEREGVIRRQEQQRQEELRQKQREITHQKAIEKI